MKETAIARRLARMTAALPGTVKIKLRPDATPPAIVPTRKSPSTNDMYLRQWRTCPWPPREAQVLPSRVGAQGLLSTPLMHWPGATAAMFLLRESLGMARDALQRRDHRTHFMCGADIADGAASDDDRIAAEGVPLLSVPNGTERHGEKSRSKYLTTSVSWLY